MKKIVTTVNILADYDESKGCSEEFAKEIVTAFISTILEKENTIFSIVEQKIIEEG